MQIRDLATASGATAQTIQFYERRGLLDPAERAGNGYRRYNDVALSRLRFIRSAQTAGLTLSEIGSIITVREAGEVPCGHVLAFSRRNLRMCTAASGSLHFLNQSCNISSKRANLLIQETAKLAASAT